MPDGIHRIILSGIIVLLLAMAGCIGNDESRLPPGTSGSTATASSMPTAVSTPGSLSDLTNQDSALAAVFINGGSVTRLDARRPVIGLSKITGGLIAPVMMTSAHDGTGRLFIADQTGIVQILTAENVLVNEPFLDLKDRMVPLNPGYDERGLLSIAFHPDYRNNGRFFVFYSAPLRPGAPAGWSCTNRLSEFSVSPVNPDKADAGSEKVLLEIDKPSSNHNGGPVVFGPDDGYLYIALGDGGRADDRGTGHTPGIGNAQDMTKFLGKILRIDVDSPGSSTVAYAIPPDNPYVSDPAVASEIFAAGLRNPSYMSFDSGGTRRILVADAGQALFESVFIVTKGGNYGWNIREGTHCFNPDDNTVPPEGPCRITGYRNEALIGPIIELGHDLGTVIVGGYVYRGSSFPEFSGSYIFGDWSRGGSTGGDGTILLASPPEGYEIGRYPSPASAVTPEDNRMWTTREFRIAGVANGRVNAYVRGFAEDENHEVYVLISRTAGPGTGQSTGEIWKLVPST